MLFLKFAVNSTMSTGGHDDEEYVDVNSLPLKPPQPLLAPERAVRRPWHPVMWDNSIVGLPTQDQSEKDEVCSKH